MREGGSEGGREEVREGGRETQMMEGGKREKNIPLDWLCMNSVLRTCTCMCRSVHVHLFFYILSSVHCGVLYT